MNLGDLSPTQLAIISLLRARDRDGKEYAPVPGRIHLVKELFAVSTTDIGKRLLSDLRFEPDNFGPYDETIFAALDELCDAHIVRYVSSKNRPIIELTNTGKHLADDVWGRIKESVKDIFTYVKMTYNHKSSEAVLEHIYSAFPEMARNSVSRVASKYKT